MIVAPSPTPFAEDDSVDYDAIERNVQRWLSTPLAGFQLNSENGEETFLSEVERLEIVRTVHRVCDNKKTIIGGIDSPSVTDTLRLAERLVDAGADLLRLRIPRLTTNVRGYFEQVVPRAPAPAIPGKLRDAVQDANDRRAGWLPVTGFRLRVRSRAGHIDRV